MRSSTRQALAGFALLTFAAPVMAADLLPPAPPLRGALIPAQEPEFASGWYLRGDIGYAHLGDVTEASYGAPTPPMVHPKLSDAWSVGGGIGYRVNSWLRFDATVDHRFGSTYTGRNSGSGFVSGYSQERANFEATTALANVYVDLGTWAGVTPYLGAGLGLSSTGFRNYVSRVVYFDGTPVPPFGYESKRTNQLAFALMGGVGIDLGYGATLDLGYRYVHLGEVATRLDTFNVGTKMKDIDAHEIRAGLRWQFAQPAPTVLSRAPIAARY